MNHTYIPLSYRQAALTGMALVGIATFSVINIAHAEQSDNTNHEGANVQLNSQSEVRVGGSGAEVNASTSVSAESSTSVQGDSKRTQQQSGEENKETTQTQEQESQHAGTSTEKVQMEASGTTETNMHHEGEAANASGTHATSGEASQGESENNTKGKTESEQHRNTVANVVQSLLTVANREGGIGEEVRTVAQTQSASASTTADAMAKVDKRSGFMTFLFGPDYKNLGEIRSASATTSANIKQLTKLAGQSTNASDTAALNVQIQALQTEQDKVNTYVQSHESVFSLFGWFTKMFSK